MSTLMNIGDAAKAAGVSAKMIRHYEQTGLLPEAERSESGYRKYGEREVSVLRFIRQSRRLGFSMAQIAELIGQWGDTGRTSRQVKAIAERQNRMAERVSARNNPHDPRVLEPGEIVTPPQCGEHVVHAPRLATRVVEIYVDAKPVIARARQSDPRRNR